MLDVMALVDRYALEKRVRVLERALAQARAKSTSQDEALGRAQSRGERLEDEVEALRSKVCGLRGVRDLAEGAQREIERHKAEAREARSRVVEAGARAEELEAKCDALKRERDDALAMACEEKEHGERAAQLLRQSHEERDLALAATDAARAEAAQTALAVESSRREQGEALDRVANLEAAGASAARLETTLREGLAAARQAAAAAEARADRAERDASRSRIDNAEVDQLRSDVRRLVQLLASTSEFRDLAAALGDEPRSYVGPRTPSEAPRCGTCRDADWATFADVAARHGATEDPLTSQESLEWAPASAVAAARRFREGNAPGLPFEAVRAFLRETNEAWLKRERRKTAQLKAAFQRRIDDIFRKTQHGLPYDKVRHDRELDRLKTKLRETRAKYHLKGRPKKTVDRRLPGRHRDDDAPLTIPTTMSHAARDNLLSASLLAMNSIAQARSPDYQEPSS